MQYLASLLANLYTLIFMTYCRKALGYGDMIFLIALLNFTVDLHPRTAAVIIKMSSGIGTGSILS